MKAILKSLAGASWLITALGSLHVGLQELGYNLLSHPMLMGSSHIFGYVFGLAGLVSLVMFVMHCCGEHMCNCSNCKCN